MSRSHRHSYAERGADLYETPGVAITALLRVEKLPRRVWEPCCGPGSIVNVLRNAGHDVIASDLNDWGCPDSQSRIDFLMERRAPDGVEAIVTNPPLKLANKFIEHAFDLVSRVIMLLPLSYLEGIGKRRCKILDGGRLRRVDIFAARLPMMHRHGWAGPRSTSSKAFAWFVWDGKRGGPAVVNRITAVPALPLPEHESPSYSRELFSRAFSVTSEVQTAPLSRARVRRLGSTGNTESKNETRRREPTGFYF